MRNAFVQVLAEDKSRSDLVVLTGDLGYRLFDNFAASHPGRFIDAGIAEANMVSMAAGLASGGLHSYCYSIVPFLVCRAMEQIRDDVGYNDLPVCLLGAGGGVSYGAEGFTHYGLEDFALMKSVPNMCILAPADSWEAAACARLSLTTGHPLYVRFGRNSEQTIWRGPTDMTLGQSVVMRDGRDVAIIAIGPMVFTALASAALLGQDGIQVTVLNVRSLRPLDEQMLLQVLTTHSLVVTLEEHYVTGGLGSDVLAIAADHQCGTHVVRAGIPDLLPRISGRPDFLLNAYGLSVERIVKLVIGILGGANG